MNGMKANETVPSHAAVHTTRSNGDDFNADGATRKRERGAGTGANTGDRFYELLALVTWVFLLLVYLNGVHKITFGLILFAPLLVVQSAILLHLVEMFAT